ncbi:MAG TPA: beta-propeller domain-containing protein [Acidimicrobiales bacterium]|nr:beta-propeller domain-containing protein [Acidimicrobiales bacterium]
MGTIRRIWAEARTPERRARTLITGAVVLVLAAGGGAAVAMQGSPVASVRSEPTTTTTTQPQTSTTSSTPATATSEPAPARPAVAPVSLVTYGGCTQLLTQVKTEALGEVGPYGLSQSGSYAGSGTVAASGTAEAGGAPAPAAASAAPAPGGSSSPGASNSSSQAATGSPSYSGTNNQEAGVDEPDLTKTDGHLLLVLRHSPVGLEVADVSTPTPHLDGFIALPQVGYNPQLLVTGGYAVIIGQGHWNPSANQSGTEVDVVSLSDPSHLSVTRSFDLQGSEQGARLIAGRILVVLQGQPNLPFVTPSGSSPAELSAATSQNQAIVKSSSLSAWLPAVTTSPGHRTRLASCQAALHPTVASGLGTISVLSLDPASSQPGQEVTVVGNASTVYASTTALYVATSPWTEQIYMTPMTSAGAMPVPSPAGGITTDIHGFDLSDPAAPRYLGSGVVPGTLIGQYAMSEYNGDLRVATTVGQATPAPGEGSAPSQLSDNRVTVLAPVAGALVPVGSVDGLGQGEKIYGVRFVGPLGYVVTFNQTDPLYVVDLSHPTHPTLDGQLALTGYSSFLQPLGGSLLLGVGEAVDSNLRQTGLQLSVFDVSNPNHPVLDSRLKIDGANSSAQNDPHALLWWPSRRLVATPVTDYQQAQPGGGGGGTSASGGSGPSGASSSSGSSGSEFNGLVVWHVDAKGTLQQVAQFAQPQPQSGQPTPGACNTCASSGGASTAPAPGPGGGTMMYYPFSNGIERAVVIGNLLYTASDTGIMATNMDSWAQAAWLAYPTS